MVKRNILFVGIGNPGEKYNLTRHNVGFLFIEKMVSKYCSYGSYSKKFSSDYITANIKENKIYLIRPTTFVNLSGNSVVQWKNYFKINIDDIFVFYDDISIPLGKIKIKNSGSSGGHNGIKSITSAIGGSYNQVKFGLKFKINENQEKIDPSKFVLDRLSTLEKEVIERQSDILINNIGLLLSKSDNDKSKIVEMASLKI